MEEVVIVRYSEIAVKGPRTRRRMEGLLVKAIEEALERAGIAGCRVEASDGRVFVRRVDDVRLAARAVSKVFGVKSVSPALEATFTTIGDIERMAVRVFGDSVRGKVFMVRARRSGVHDFTSKDVEARVGRALLDSGAKGVSLSRPEYVAYIEVRGGTVLFYSEVIEGPGGLPIGSEDPVLLLYSGGFDSTVAAWRLMKRGVPVYMVLYDYGVPEAVRVAVEAAKFLADEWAYGYRPKLYLVNFRGAALVANGLVAPHYVTLTLRRLMLEHASSLAKKLGIEALATGESIGQVASQTIRSLYLISRGLDMPVIRPLAGHDKDEIVKEAMRIGVYDIVKRQVEVCGVDRPPTPRGSLERFEKEYDKIKDVMIPDPVEVDLKGRSLQEILAEIRIS